MASLYLLVCFDGAMAVSISGSESDMSRRPSLFSSWGLPMVPVNEQGRCKDLGEVFGRRAGLHSLSCFRNSQTM